jgi:SNF2 family DNA or RNA helicase
VTPDTTAFAFQRELTASQKENVARLLAMRNGGNFSVPGSGKTTVAYKVWATERVRDEVDALLVVAPLSAFEAWQEEAVACFRPGHKPKVHLLPDFVPHDADVVVIGYPRLTQRRLLADLDGWLSTRRVMIVFDESHRVKAGQAGTWGRAAARLARRCERRYVLSGTPMPNGIEDLVAQFDLCWPGRGRQLAHSGQLERLFVRTTKGELDLPDLTTRVERVPLDADHRRVYDALAGRTLDMLSDQALAADVRALGGALMRLIAAATNPAAILDVGRQLELPVFVEGMQLDALIKNTASVLRPAKLVRAAQLVDANAAAGRKTLLWSAFVANVAALAALLAAHNPAVITGGTVKDDAAAATDRARELHRFRTDPTCEVLVATPQTLGEGISLHHTCVDQIHVDRIFNAGIYLQSIDRTHRLGMDPASRPTLTILIADDTIDLAVHESVQAKIARMSAALNDPALAQIQLTGADEVLSLREILLDGASSATELRGLLLRVRGR